MGARHSQQPGFYGAVNGNALSTRGRRARGTGTPTEGTTVSTAPDQPVDPSAQVAVTLDDCAKEDAATVLGTLHASFSSDRSPDDLPADSGDGSPMVWTATFDVSRTLGLPGPARLTAPVDLTAQGGYRAVDRLREGLAEAFSVKVTGTAAGDQEQEARLRLDNR
jgi:hypothetical protein